MRNGLIATLVFVLVAGGVGAAFLVVRALRGTGDVLAKVTPDNTAFYLSIYLDPPTAQKSSFNTLLHRFPDVSNDQQRDDKVDQIIDSALEESHLNHNDVRAWLGSQVSVIAPADLLAAGVGAGGGRRTRPPTPQFIPASVSLTQDSGEPSPPFGVLIASKDDTKAHTTLDTFRHSTAGKSYTWTDDNHDGITVSRGTPEAEGTPIAYAVVNHAAVIASTIGVVDDVIDTAHGRRPALDSTDAYKKAIASLPSDNLALGYLDLRGILAKLSDEFRGNGSGSGFPKGLGLEAVGSFAMTATAQPDGIALDGGVTFDPSKLTDQQRSLLGLNPSTSKLAAAIPSTAFGFLTLPGINHLLDAVVKQVGSIDPSVAEVFQELGLAGRDSIVPHLTGDAALEVQPRTGSSLPMGALILATDDGAAMGRFLDSVAQGLAHAFGTSKDENAPLSRKDAAYPGGTITGFLPPGGTADGLIPCYTVSHGLGIIATRPEAVVAVLAAQAGDNVTNAQRYRDAIAQAQSGSSGSTLYVDIVSVVAAVHDALPPPDREDYDRSGAAKDLAPLKSLIVTGTSSSDRSGFRMFLTIT